jgi:hypothetical protein
MSKYIVLGVMLMATIVMAIVPVSIRMRGLGPGLVGIVDDEYSDLFLNPAFINYVEGSRIYTNLSNIHNFGDDLFFSGDYSPDMFYNLIGGITSYKDMKVGGLLETGGINYTGTDMNYSTDIIGCETYADSLESEMVCKDLNTSINLFWGKKIADYNVGVWFGPQFMDMEQSYDDVSMSHYWLFDTLGNVLDHEYEYEREQMANKAKTYAYPFMIGAISGTYEDELSANFTFGFDRVNGIIPVNFISSELTHEISQDLSSLDESYEYCEQKTDQGGFYLALNGRNKKRMEDHSLSYLGSIVYVHQPLTMTVFDTTYDYSDYETDYISLTATNTRQEGTGATDYFALALGIGTEKKFDAFGASSMFAIGLIPSYFSGKSTMTMEPSETNAYTYYTYPDTMESTTFYSNGETYDYEYCYGGFTATIPVGLEMHLTDRLVLRLGVTQDMMLKFKDCDEVTMTDNGWTQHIVSGPFDTTYYEPANELDSYYSKTEDKVTFNTMTTYHYGMGFKVNDNIELNFLNFADLTNLKSWVLGVNIKI